MLNENLKNARINMKYTQDDVAEHLNVKRQTYSAYETGKSTPDAQTLKQLAILFKISSDFLLDIHNAGNECLLTDNERRLINKLRSLDENKRAVVEAMIDLTI